MATTDRVTGYLVLAIQPWADVRVSGRLGTHEVTVSKGGLGWLPVYLDREQAQADYPGHALAEVQVPEWCVEVPRG